MFCITRFPDGTRTWTDGVSTVRLNPDGELSGQWQWQHGSAIPFTSDSLILIRGKTALFSPPGARHSRILGPLPRLRHQPGGLA